MPNLNIYPLNLKMKTDKDEAGKDEDEFPKSKPFGDMVEYPRNTRLTQEPAANSDMYHFVVDCERPGMEG
jgi:hypothetical protein